jgi:hypothetical protein
MKNLIIIIFLASFLMGFVIMPGNKISEKLITDFKSTDWPTVMKAKESIENLEKDGIPQLMTMLNDFSIRRLKNTGDLIYPGAVKFYGHGQIIEYDIDEISIRAGWLLEDLTFQNFGFSGIHLPDNEILDFIQHNFPDYISSTANKQKLDKMTTAEKRKLIKSLSIKKAQVWWNSESESWNRLNALVNALKSTDEKRQVKALFYIRNGKTKCSGLNKAYYEAELIELMRELAKTELKRVSENAKLILMDIDFEWLALKPADQL